jgi:hypothetical protein
MKITFSDDDTLIIIPESGIEAMALKYWKKEFDEHGSRVLEVVTDVTHRLTAPPG